MLGRDAQLILDRSLALVHLDYCSSVLRNADARTLRMLQVAQNACVRFICNVPRASYFTEHRPLLGFLTLAARMRLQCLILLHGMVYRSWPPALLKTLHLVSGDAFRRDRSTGTRRYMFFHAAALRRDEPISILPPCGTRILCLTIYALSTGKVPSNESFLFIWSSTTGDSDFDIDYDIRCICNLVAHSRRYIFNLIYIIF